MRKTPKKIIKSSVGKMNSPEVMKPLNDYMARNNINTRMLADKMCFTRQNIGYMLKHDTTRVSSLEKIAEAMDCRLHLSLSRGGTIYNNMYPWVPPACGPKDLVPVRLSFLSEAMSKNYLDIQKVAIAVGLKDSSIRHWFHVDDVQVNHVKKFADAFGFEFEMSFMPKKKAAENTEEECVKIAKILKAFNDPILRPAIEALLKL